MEEYFDMTTDDGTELDLIWFRDDELLAVLYDGVPIISVREVYSESRIGEMAECIGQNLRRQRAEDKAAVTRLIMEIQAAE